MLESPDEENIIVALTCIENSDFKANIAYVLLMMKESNVAFKNWPQYAPKTMEKYRALGILTEKRTLTYKKILEVILDYKVSVKDIQFFMNRFALSMMNDINSKRGPGESLIEHITIKINNEQNGSTGESLERLDAEGTVLRDVPDNAEQEVG